MKLNKDLFKSATSYGTTVLTTKKEEIGYKPYNKWKRPRIITIDGERFDYMGSEKMPLSGMKYTYSNYIRFECNHPEDLEKKIAVFW